MLMSVLYTVFAGGFIAIAALGHLLVFNALTVGKTESKPSAEPAYRPSTAL